MDVAPGSGAEGSVRVLPRPLVSCGCRQPWHFGGAPPCCWGLRFLLPPRSASAWRPAHVALPGCMESRWASPSPFAGPQPRPPSLGWTPWGQGGGRGPRALRGPPPRVESLQGLPTSGLLGLLVPRGVSRGGHLPPGRPPGPQLQDPPAPSCSRSCQPRGLRAVSGHSLSASLSSSSSPPPSSPPRNPLGRCPARTPTCFAAILGMGPWCPLGPWADPACPLTPPTHTIGSGV